jgi:cell division protein FtsB
MNRHKSQTTPTLNAGLIARLVLLTLLVAGTGVGYVFIKVQQHDLGEQTRQAESRISELRAVNQALRSELSTLTSHASIREALTTGTIALVAVSDQFVARLTPVAPAAIDLATQTASASPGDRIP